MGHKSDDIPSGLRARRDRLKLSRDLVATELGIDPSTLQRWEMPVSSEHHRRISAADHRRVLAYYDAKEAGSHNNGVPRGTSLSPRLEALLSAFERDMVRLGATDAEADYVRAALTSDEARRFYLGGPSAPLEPDQQERELKLQMEALRTWVQLRIRARDGAVDDRPSYLRVAEQYGGEVATGSTELPGNKKAPAKKAASAVRRRRPKG